MEGNKQLAIQIAKEITIAKLSQSAPTHSDGSSGKAIGEMFEAIYDKVLEVTSK